MSAGHAQSIRAEPGTVNPDVISGPLLSTSAHNLIVLIEGRGQIKMALSGWPAMIIGPNFVPFITVS
jgi:hypothetical protein